MKDNTEIELEIQREIKSRYYYGRTDFIFNHILLLIVVVASSYPAFSEIFDSGDSKATAIIAAIPAFILFLQRTFKWEQRAEWHWDYRRRLKAIQREMRDQGLDSQDASKKLNALEQELAGSFPGLSFAVSRQNDSE